MVGPNGTITLEEYFEDLYSSYIDNEYEDASEWEEWVDCDTDFKSADLDEEGCSSPEFNAEYKRLYEEYTAKINAHYAE
ncbi:MAG: hypothetical protein Q4F95_07520 [Oscillospiraceae bacterium]|nr:hypothetical protein [Oscillospiraceae bacterium]